MKQNIEKGKNIIINKIVEPLEKKIDIPKINIIGNEEITIENHKGIIYFEKNEIKINSNLGVLSIKGSKFEIAYIGEYTLIVCGIFTSVGYERRNNV